MRLGHGGDPRSTRFLPCQGEVLARRQREVYDSPALPRPLLPEPRALAALRRPRALPAAGMRSVVEGPSHRVYPGRGRRFSGPSYCIAA